MRLLANIQSLYGWNSAWILATLFAKSNNKPITYLRSVWVSRDFRLVKPAYNQVNRDLASLLRFGMLLQLAVGLTVLFYAADNFEPGYFLFGLAIIVAYPLVWAHVLVLAAMASSLVGACLSVLKKIGKSALCWLLERQVVRLREKYQFSLVAVAGSVGKTSTKLAIARVLEQSRRVRFQDGNYNDRLSVPLVVFGSSMPGLYNVFAWAKILYKNSRIIATGFDWDTVVVELGTDEPGQMSKFGYLRPNLTVLTAVQPEHMEQFKTLDSVADEELRIFKYSQRVLVNEEDVDAKYLKGREYVTYGGKKSNYALTSHKQLTKEFGKQRVNYNLAGHKTALKINFLGRQGAKVALAAAAAACETAISIDDVKSALGQLQSPAGRMHVFKGIKNSTIIDDTYNASPAATAAALDVLRLAKTKQRIAVLGSMNELGATSRKLHRELGKLCGKSDLDFVVTIGREANEFLAPSAKSAGCTVYKFVNPTEAGIFVSENIKSKAVVLAKGSQNGVFAEEAVKQLLTDTDDSAKLVRQSPGWLKIKRRQFGD